MNNVEAIIHRIKHITSPLDIDEELWLIEKIRMSNDFEVIRCGALAIYDHKINKGLPVLMEKLRDPHTILRRDTLLFSCSEFECSKYFKLIFSLAISSKYSSAIEAVDLLEGNCNEVIEEDILWASCILNLMSPSELTPDQCFIYKRLCEIIM